MAKIFPIVKAIAGVLESIDGLTVYKEPPRTVDTPAAAVYLAPLDYDTTMNRDSDDMAFVIDLFMTDGPQGIENLYEYLDSDGDRSVIARLAEDPTLGGLVDFAVLSVSDRPDRITVGTSDFVHVELLVSVAVSGTS